LALDRAYVGGGYISSVGLSDFLNAGPWFLVWSTDGTAAGKRFYVNGRQRGTPDATTPGTIPTSDKYLRVWGWGANWNVDGRVLMAGWMKSYTTPDVAAEFAANPWQILRPKTNRRFFFPISAPAGTAVATIRTPPRSAQLKPPVGTEIDWSHPLSQGLVGCWHFGDYGIKAHDLGPYRVNGVADSQSEFTKTVSPRGVALRRGANWNNEISVPQTAAFHLKQQHTLEVYFNPQVGSATRRIWRYFTSSGNYLWRCYITGDDILYFDCTDGSLWDLLAWQLPSDDRWIHAVRTWINGTVAELWVDGVLRDTGNFGSFTMEDTFQYHYFQDEYPNSGIVAYARAWNRRMKPSEIQQLYVEPFAMMRAPRTRMVLYTAGAGPLQATADIASASAASLNASVTGINVANVTAQIASATAGTLGPSASGINIANVDASIAAALAAALSNSVAGINVANVTAQIASAIAAALNASVTGINVANVNASIAAAVATGLASSVTGINTASVTAQLANAIATALNASAELAGTQYASATIASAVATALASTAVGINTANVSAQLAVAIATGLIPSASGINVANVNAAIASAIASSFNATVAGINIANVNASIAPSLASALAASATGLNVANVTANIAVVLAQALAASIVEPGVRQNLCGFENVVDLRGECWDRGGTVYPSVATDIKRSGLQSLLIDVNTSDTSYLFFGKYGTAGGHAGLNLATLYYRTYIYIKTPVSTGYEEITRVTNANGDLQWALALTSAGKLRVLDKNGNQVGSDGATVLASERWYRIEGKVTAGSSAPFIVKINGVQEFNASCDTGTVNLQRVQLGKSVNRSSGAYKIYMDDFAIDSSAFCGTGRIAELLIDGNGYYTNWTASSGEKYQCIDETQPDDDASYIYTNVNPSAYTASLQSYAAAGISGTIKAVKGVLWARKEGGIDCWLKLRLRSNTTDSDTTASSPTNDYDTIQRLWLTDPHTGSPWALAALNSCEIGAYHQTTNTNRVTKASLYVEYETPDYLEASATIATAIVTALQARLAARVNFIGFECGNLDYEIYNSSNATLSQSVVHSGAYALRVNANTGFVQIGGIDTDGYFTNLNLPMTWASFYFRCANAPSSGSQEICALLQTGLAYKFSVRLTSDRKLAIYDSTGTQIGSDGTSVLNLNQWYRIEVKCGKGATGPYQVRIDGVEEFSGTANVGTGNCTYYIAGCYYDRGGGGTVDFYYDDVIIDAIEFVSNARIHVMRPIDQGFYDGWTASAASKAECVDEIPPDDEATYIHSAVANDAWTGDLQTPGQAGITGTIRAIKVFAIARELSAEDDNLRLRMRSQAIDYDSNVIYTGSSYNSISKVYQVNPITNAPWSITDLQALELGFVRGQTNPDYRVTIAILMVEHEAGAALEATAGIAEASAIALSSMTQFPALDRRSANEDWIVAELRDPDSNQTWQDRAQCSGCYAGIQPVSAPSVTQIIPEMIGIGIWRTV